jgi:hypothetical protein
VSRLNISAPSGEHRRLRGPELTARGLKGFGPSDPSIAREVKLPDFEQSNKTAWPPPKVPLGVDFAQSMMIPATPYANAEWWKGIEERERQKREIDVEMVKHYEAQTKAQEDRINAEARANFEALRKRRDVGPE